MLQMFIWSVFYQSVIGDMCVSSSQSGFSALHHAANASHIEVVKVLLNVSADINLMDKVRLCVLMCLYFVCI